MRIPLLSVAINSWQLASQAFANEDKKYCRRQKWRSFYYALIHPGFTTRWFKILKSPDFLPATIHRPRLYFKPFRVYMSIKWTKAQKVKVILDTYRFIMSKGEAFMQVLASSEGVKLVSFKLNETIEGSLILGYEYKYRKEGELVMFFRCEQLGGVISLAAFSFEEIEPDQWACRIACVQGHRLSDENSSKVAQKLMHGLRPKSLVVFVLQEFARQLGCVSVYGAGDSIQAYRQKHLIHLHWRHTIQFDYNAIWSECSGIARKDGWYEIPIIPVRKDYHEIKPNKRSLYVKRFAMLDDLSLKIEDAVKRLAQDRESPTIHNLTSPVLSHSHSATVLI